MAKAGEAVAFSAEETGDSGEEDDATERAPNEFRSFLPTKDGTYAVDRFAKMPHMATTRTKRQPMVDRGGWNEIRKKVETDAFETDDVCTSTWHNEVMCHICGALSALRA